MVSRQVVTEWGREIEGMRKQAIFINTKYYLLSIQFPHYKPLKTTNSQTNFKLTNKFKTQNIFGAQFQIKRCSQFEICVYSLTLCVVHAVDAFFCCWHNFSTTQALFHLKCFSDTTLSGHSVYLVLY